MPPAREEPSWTGPLPRPARALSWNFRAFRWALAPTLAVLALTFFLYRAFWQIPPGVRAEVESIDGSASRISDAGDAPISAGDKLNEGDHLRTSGGAHAVLRLSDGSTVEVNERSVLAVGARGRNMTVAVDSGAVIVQAAKRTSGHLYVKTPDCRVAVTGTVFSVNAGIKGSRVAVLQGTVHVTHAGIETLMHAGDQISTNENLSSEPVDQQIAWSRDLDKYLPLLAQFSTLQHRIDQIPDTAAQVHERSAGTCSREHPVLCQHSQSRQFSERGEQYLPRPVEAESGTSAVVGEWVASQYCGARCSRQPTPPGERISGR